MGGPWEHMGGRLEILAPLLHISVLTVHAAHPPPDITPPCPPSARRLALKPTEQCPRGFDYLALLSATLCAPQPPSAGPFPKPCPSAPSRRFLDKGINSTLVASYLHCSDNLSAPRPVAFASHGRTDAAGL